MFFKVGSFFYDRESFFLAALFFRLAGIFRDASSINNLAAMYEEGLGVSQSFAKAELLYKKAYLFGEMVAITNIADMYVKRDDFSKAERWYQFAVLHGHLDAKVELCKAYIKKERPEFLAKARETYNSIVEHGKEELSYYSDEIDEINSALK